MIYRILNALWPWAGAILVLVLVVSWVIKLVAWMRVALGSCTP